MDLWEPKQRIERTFRRNLKELAKRIIAEIGGTDNSNLICEKLLKIALLPEFQSFAESVATRMATHLFEDNGRTWRQAAMANGKGQPIYQALQKELQGRTGKLLLEQVQRNAAIIKTLPSSIASDVTAYISKETQKGRRASDIAKEIMQKFPEQTRARADLIARTEVSKTQSALIESRCRQFGVNWYVWHACGGSNGDGRTRKSHRGMANVLVCWDDPPAPEDLFPAVGKSGRKYHNSLGRYHAGCCPNCRCYAEPVIDLDMFTWPMRIYRGGSIRKISRKDFMKMVA